MPLPHFVRLALIAGLLWLGPGVAGAEVVNVPPVVISTLTHNYQPPTPFDSHHYIWDGIPIPGSGYTSDGFTAAIGLGDEVRIRFEAPPGKKFVVHHHPSLIAEFLRLSAYWSAEDEGGSANDPDTVLFENLTGTAPAPYYSHVTVLDNGTTIYCVKHWQVTGDFEFTAIELRIFVSHAIPDTLRSYGAVESYSALGFGVASEDESGPDRTLLEVVDLVPIVNVPPVVISSLTHTYQPPNPPFSPNAVIRDAITIPGSGYTSSGFTATLRPGGMVVLRYEAPPGQMFTIDHAPDLLSMTLFMNTYWLAASDAISNVAPHSVVFENLVGPTPVQTYSLVGVGNGGAVVHCTKQYAVSADIAFTAVEVRMVPTHAFPQAPRTYGAVQSSSSASWGVAAQTSGTFQSVLAGDRVLLRVVPSTIGVPGSTVEPEPPFSLALVSSNPGSGSVTAEFALEDEAHVRLRVLDVQGREVAMMADGVYGPGNHRLTWVGERTPSGVYFLQGTVAGQSLVRRVVVVQ